MADWRDRCEINEDVVYFRYVTPGVEKNIDEVFVWDLDKTYLDTAIESVSQLIRTAIERAFNKKKCPGNDNALAGSCKNLDGGSRANSISALFYFGFSATNGIANRREIHDR